MREETLVAGMLLAVFAALAVTSVATWSATSDEVPHLAAGYSYVQTGDFRLNPQHPPLIKALAAMPLCFLDLKRVEELSGWKERRDRDFGHAFLLDNYEPLPTLLFLGRLPAIGIGLLLGIGLFLWARDLWGFPAAACVLFCFSLSPSLLAHVGLVTTDAGLACFTVWALYALWRWSETRSRRDAVACGVAVGLALLTKYSGLLTLGMVGLLIVATWSEGRPPRVALGAAAWIVLSAALLVTVGYGFPKGLVNYAWGIGQINRDFDLSQPAFLWGEHSAQGFWYYYLLAQLWKTPLPVLILFGVALVTLRARDDRERLKWMFVLGPVVVFHLAGVFYRPNIGLRHVLPVLPFLLLAAGDATRRLAASGRNGRIALAVLAVWQLAGTLYTYPHFLAYFNELAGGPANGVHYLGDSNLEWGQDIAGMRDYIERQRPRHVRAAVFAPLPLEAQGIRQNEPIKLRDLVWPEEGVDYFVGTGFLQRPSYLAENPAVRFRWLERYVPADAIGWSIYVYRFSTDEADRERSDVMFVPKERWYEDARAQLEQILSFTPGFTDARRVLARVYEERSAWQAQGGAIGASLDDALRTLVLEATPERRSLARAAIDAYARSETAVEGSTEASCVLAKARARTGDAPAAVPALLDCLRRAPEDVAAARLLAEIYERFGLVALARQEWERCLRVEPGHGEARAALERLSSAEEPGR